MDFSKLKISDQVTKADFPTAEVTFEQFQNGNGKPLSIRLNPANSPVGRRELRKWMMRYPDSDNDNFPSLSEADLDAEIDRQNAAGTELPARLIHSWNVQNSSGESIDCTLDNKMAFLRTFEDVLTAVSHEMACLAGELGNSKPT